MRFRIPASHQLATFRFSASRQGYSQHIIIQTNKLRLAENKVKVLERLRHPEALLRVHLDRRRNHRIRQRSERELRFGRFLDGAKHLPCDVLVFLVACDAVEDENGLDSFWSAGCQYDSFEMQCSIMCTSEHNAYRPLR